MAINVRGIFAVATRRVDDPTARRLALADCNRMVHREVPIVRPIDHCMTYAVGNNVVWSYRCAAAAAAALRSGRAAIASHRLRCRHGAAVDGRERAHRISPTTT